MTQNSLSATQRTLFNNLTRELFQTETSAFRHCTREADRLGTAAPAIAMRSVAMHAKNVLAELPALAKRNDMIISKGAMLTGELFSQARDKVADMLIDHERSYRGTLLGMHHGVDVVRLLEDFAEVTNKPDLAEFCGSWLKTRTALVEQAAEQLHWFAKHPEVAVELGSGLLPRLRSLTLARAQKT